MAHKNIPTFKSDFPLYCLHIIGERHLLVAGGGGASKTGIQNAIDIYEIKYDNNMPVMHRVNHFDTKTRAVMNCSVIKQDKSFLLAAGLDNNCCLYSLRYKIMVPKNENEVLEGVRKRKNNLTNSTNHNTAIKMIGFDIEMGEEIVTDKNPNGAFQKVVKFSPNKTYFATGGSEGVLRCWDLQNLKNIFEVKTHKNEIDDIDISPDSKYIVSIGKDSHGFVWSSKDGSPYKTLQWKHECQFTHRTRNCRYGRVYGSDNYFFLITTHIPVVRTPKSSSYLVKWETPSYRNFRNILISDEILSSLSISDDGRYVATGTISGNVTVFSSSTFQKIHHVSSAHSIFVTGLEFGPTSLLSQGSLASSDFTLFSVSADNCIKIHQKDKKVSSNKLLSILAGFLFLFLFSWICHTYRILDLS